MAWGHVKLKDTGRMLEIRHHGAPLEMAFGRNSQCWSAALLEGVYETWLHAAGASESLHVNALDSGSRSISDDPQTLVFSLNA
jgi:hypothetical protein